MEKKIAKKLKWPMFAFLCLADEKILLIDLKKSYDQDVLSIELSLAGGLNSFGIQLFLLDC